MITSGFFTSRNGDRKYTAEQITTYFKGLIGNGIVPPDKFQTGLRVSAVEGKMQVQVELGKGFIDGYWIENDSPHFISINTSEISLNRKDTIVMQLDKAERKMSIEYIPGTPAVDPMEPMLVREDLVKQYRLANVYVAAGATSISQSNITDTRSSDECGWVTGLIDQVDTSTLFDQWQTAYEEAFDEFNKIYLETGNRFDQFLDDNKKAYDEWFATLTGELNVGVHLVTYESGYTNTEETTTIPIQIPQYDHLFDILQAYINGVYLVKGVDYTIDATGTSIVLKNSIMPNQYINFIVIKNIIGTGGTTIASEVAALGNQVNGIVEKIGVMNGVYSVTVTLPSTAGTVSYNLPAGCTALNTIVLDIVTTELGVSIIRSSSVHQDSPGRLTLDNTTYGGKEVKIIMMKFA